MEEVTGSIPVRSTNQFKHLEAPPFRDLVAFLSQIPKPCLKLSPDSMFGGRSFAHCVRLQLRSTTSAGFPLDVVGIRHQGRAAVGFMASTIRGHFILGSLAVRGLFINAKLRTLG
jgi:hypothetical protein